VPFSSILSSLSVPSVCSVGPLFRLLLVLLLPSTLPAADVTLALRAPLPLHTPATLHSVGANSLSLTRLSALVSSVAFVRPDGSFAQLEGQFGALDLASGRDRFILRGVPPGAYQGLQFLVGLRPAANHSDPAQWPAAHPLNPLLNGLHWDWQGGYIFLALEGRYARVDGSLGGWSYHLARDERLTLVQLPFPLTLPADAPATTLTLELDLSAVLAGLVLAPDTDTTHSRPGDLVADRLVQNLPGAFRVVAVGAAPAATSPASGSSTAPSFAPATPGRPLPFVVPSGFSQVELPADNPLTLEGVELGRRLFRDPRLSGDGTQSCADCHQPAHAFSDPRSRSLGIDGLPGERHSMPLFNLAWSPNYAWDGSQPRIRDQALAAMRNPREMHADPEKVAATLSTDDELGARFASAFGDKTITPDRISRALEQHLLTLVSADSRFDRAVRGELELTEQEKEGFALFATEFDPARGQRGADCFHCHGGTLFTDYQPKHNGLDLASADVGRARATDRPADAGKFKTPSLRNIALTAPYMHDGRFKTLEDVLAHYDHGVRRAANLDPNLAKHPPEGLQLSPDEKSALLAFLRALTDETLAEK
jgi:cytochrome c peroxidase